MMRLTAEQYGVAILLFSIPILLVVTYLTRPTARRLLGAGAGGLITAVLGFLWDLPAHAFGWWHYPFTSGPFAPYTTYATFGLVFGSGGTLIGWRVARRYGTRGLLLFLIGLSLAGSARDHAVAAFNPVPLVVFAPGIPSLLADLAAWTTALFAAQSTMWLVAGPAASDRLAQWPIPRRDKPASRKREEP